MENLLTLKLFDMGFWYNKKVTRLPTLSCPAEISLCACTSMRIFIPRLTILNTRNYIEIKHFIEIKNRNDFCSK